MPADGARVGMAGHKGARRALGDLVEALVVEMRHVEDHAHAFHLGQCGHAHLGEAGVAVVAARERALRVPGERGHEHADALEHLDKAEVGGEQARVLDGMDGHDAACLQHRANVCRRARLGDLLVVQVHLAGRMRHDLRVKENRLLRRVAVGDERREALRPGRFVDLVERDGAVVHVERDEVLGLLRIVLAVEVRAADAAQLQVEGLPA